MKTHVEITIRLRSAVQRPLHDVLAAFARETNRWDFPVENSTEYQTGHGSQAGFAVWLGNGKLPPAAVAIANFEAKKPEQFCVPNIVPHQMSSLTLDEYNQIGEKFVNAFRTWLKKSKTAGSINISSPNKTLKDIIGGEKTRRFFQAWVHSPTPLSHPSDLHALNRFICHLFRHRGKAKTWEIEPYLVSDLGWTKEAARTAVARIDSGLELLRVNRRF